MNAFQIFLVIGILLFSTQAQADQLALESALKMQAEIEKIMNNLEEQEKEHFFTILQNHNLLTAVDVVKDDVAEAVESCADRHSEIKDAILARFKDWKRDIKPIEKQAKQHIDKVIKDQDYAKESDIKNILKWADTLREDTDNQFKKVPITKLEACEYLMAKMDETQDELVQLMQSVMVDIPQQAEDIQ